MNNNEQRLRRKLTLDYDVTSLVLTVQHNFAKITRMILLSLIDSIRFLPTIYLISFILNLHEYVRFQLSKHYLESVKEKEVNLNFKINEQLLYVRNFFWLPVLKC